MTLTTADAVSNSAPNAARLEPREEDVWAYAVQTRSGEWQTYGDGDPAFVVRVPDRSYWATLIQANPYSVAAAFVRGDFDVEGDLLEAIRWWETQRQTRGPRELAMWAISRLRPESWFQTSARARRNIRFHYDRSNLFYQQFLDRRLVYSCAYFADPSWTLDEAQAAKLDHICRKLDLRRDDRFLDIGSGWGALVFHAAEHYGAHSTGCTLSAQQFDFAQAHIASRTLKERVSIHDCDYRELRGSFTKIASVGMFEHVGRRRLGGYFGTVAQLLDRDGLFLNHGIIRPRGVSEGASTVFLQRRVFPGGELPYLAEVIDRAQRAGFEVLDVENLRPHYALTCAAWVIRLQQHRNTCLSLVDAETYRTWLLYLASAAVSFERARTDVYQVLLAKRTAPVRRRLTRAYMYDSGSSAIVTVGSRRGVEAADTVAD
jgi:cyclopropane-fatty-acyl-phospholipid synthase